MSTKKMDNAVYESLWLNELRVFADQSHILQVWEPLRYLDKGQFSRVYKVKHKKTGELAALKYIANPLDVSDCAEEGSQQDEFYRSCFEASKQEVKIMNHFHGEKYIAQYLEKPEFLRRTFVNENGKTVVQYAVFICMPLYRSHKEWLSLAEKNSNVSLQLGLNIARALMLFEKKGVYHRDVKPGNIMLDKEGRFCLSDVGEAKMENDLTTIGFHGTKPYMAPEVLQLEGQRTKTRSDHRSDIYSLGIVLYKLYNHNQYPFMTKEGVLSESAARSYQKYEKRTKSAEKALYLTDGERARRLRYDGQKLPPPAQADARLARIILKACAYSAKDRYQKAVDLYADLRDYAKTLVPVIPPKTKPAKPGSRKHWLWLLALLLALLALLGIWWAAMSTNEPENPVPTATVSAAVTGENTAPTESETPEPAPTPTPTKRPTQQPSEDSAPTPTAKPAEKPTAKPTEKPTEKPTAAPTSKPTEKPTAVPTTPKPTEKPTEKPTAAPTAAPCPTEPPITPQEDEIDSFVDLPPQFAEKIYPPETEPDDTPVPSQESSGSSNYFDPYTDMSPTVESDGIRDEDEFI